MIEALTSPAEVQANLAAARKELGMLRAIQPRLSGIPARHNAARIVEKAEVVATLEFHADALAYYLTA